MYIVIKNFLDKSGFLKFISFAIIFEPFFNCENKTISFWNINCLIAIIGINIKNYFFFKTISLPPSFFINTCMKKCRLNVYLIYHPWLCTHFLFMIYHFTWNNRNNKVKWQHFLNTFLFFFIKREIDKIQYDRNLTTWERKLKTFTISFHVLSLRYNIIGRD